jgi:hypothetical protein
VAKRASVTRQRGRCGLDDLTLGISASIFAIVAAVLLTPPPFPDPESLVILVRRVLTATSLAFALLAVVLAGIGSFGVVAYHVASSSPRFAVTWW